MNDLDRQLSSRGPGAEAADGKAVPAQHREPALPPEGLRFETPYLDLLAKEYGADRCGWSNFVEAGAEPSRHASTTGSRDATENRIVDLLADGSITPDTRAVLVNAIYFNAAWKTAFDRATAAASFHRSTGRACRST